MEEWKNGRMEREMWKPGLKGFGICVLLLLFLFPAFVTASAPSILDGKWKLNERESDSPRAKFQEAWKAEQGSHRHEGHERRPPESFEPGAKAKNERPLGLFSDIDEFSLSSTGTETKIVDSTGGERVLYLDGRRSEFPSDHDRTVGFLARWEGDSLVVESLTNRAGEVSETAYLSPDKKQLYVKMRVQPLMLEHPVFIIRVYDAVGK